MTRLQFLPALVVLLLLSFAAADQTTEALRQGGAVRGLRKLLQDSQRVSIYDGVLASPALGPQAAEAAAILAPGGLVPSPLEALAFTPLPPELAPAAAAPSPADLASVFGSPVVAPLAAPLAAPVPAPVPGAGGLPAGSSGTTITTGGSSCSRGCIIGSIFGTVVGALLLASIVIYTCCRRRDVRSREIMSTGDLELLDNQARVASGNTPLKYQAFAIGDLVFCKRGRHSISGRVVSQEKGNAYRVLYRDGSEEVVDNNCMAPDYQPGTVVLYSPPQGGTSITGSMIHADGSFWPPFYQLRPHNGKTDSIDTTAEFLSLVRSTPTAGGLSYINADASSARSMVL